MGNNSYLLIVIIILLIIGLAVGIALKGNPISTTMTQAGIGSILAATFFGIVRPILMNKPADSNLLFVILVMYFLWYVIVKVIELYLINKNTTQEELKDIKNKPIPKGNLGGLYNAFMGVIVIMIIVILGITIYNDSQTNSGKQTSIFTIMMTVLIAISMLFSFFSGAKLNYEEKIEILSYTFSFLIIFGVLTPILFLILLHFLE